MDKMFLIIKNLIVFTVIVIISGKANGGTEQKLIQNYESGEWINESNSFYCSLNQSFDNYAKLELIKLPSKPEQLVFTWLLPDREITDIQIISRKADWQSKGIVLPQVNFFSADMANSIISFDTDPSSLLRVIKQGGWLDTIIGFGDEQLRLTFTNTYSNAVVNSYQQCLDNLSPLTWSQARDNEIFFDTGSRTVENTKDLMFLKDLVRYVSLDTSVKKVMIDGHTDNVGSPLANRLLSKERADDVASRLIEFGLPSNMLEVRAHGQRYPLVENTKLKQASNRRVLIRLFRHSN